MVPITWDNAPVVWYLGSGPSFQWQGTYRLVDYRKRVTVGKDQYTCPGKKPKGGEAEVAYTARGRISTFLVRTIYLLPRK